jgi:predicted nuclease with TOPRIM domain
MDQEIRKEFENLREFLRENMATKQDLQDLRSEVATKEELRVLTNSIDAYAKLAKDYFEEMTVLSGRVKRMEAWIQRAAEKIGVRYEP